MSHNPLPVFCRLVLTHAVMAGFFNPSLDRVIAKALQMLARAGGAETIVLVGGFSSSRYAARYLRKALEVQGRPVVAPSYRRSAVLEGAWGGGSLNYGL